MGGQNNNSTGHLQDNGQAYSGRGQKDSTKTESYITSNRATGFILLTIMFGIYWVYGWASEVRLVTGTNSPVTPALQGIFGNIFILSAIFTIIGFGLLFTFFKDSTATAFFTSIFIVSFTYLISPIFQKFWFNIFITNFQGGVNVTSSPDKFLQDSMGGLNIYVDFYNLKFTLANAISQLVLAFALFGKLTPSQIVIGSFLFNFAWNLNHFLCILLNLSSPDHRIFDDYQISSVYLFAASFGIVVCQLLKKPKLLSLKAINNDNSAIMGLLGTFFLFLSFCATTTFFTLKFNLVVPYPARTIVWQEAFIGTFFALSASVIFTYTWSILFSSNNDKIGLLESIIGTIMGAVLYGPVAGTCINIGASIAIGLLAGFLSALFYQKIYKSINQNGVRDSFGLIGIFIISFIATFFISPIVLKTYYNYDVTLPTLNTGIITNVDAAGWVLVYVGISIGIGLVTGLITGLILYSIDKITGQQYTDHLIFWSMHGLRYSKGDDYRHDDQPAQKNQDGNILMQVNSADQMRKH